MRRSLWHSWHLALPDMLGTSEQAPGSNRILAEQQENPVYNSAWSEHFKAFFSCQTTDPVRF
jgi:hypothetical protein